LTEGAHTVMTVLGRYVASDAYGAARAGGSGADTTNDLRLLILTKDLKGVDKPTWTAMTNKGPTVGARRAAKKAVKRS
jgi:hypothetical protein